MEEDRIDYYQRAPYVTIQQCKKSIKFIGKNGKSLVINNKERRLTLDILCKKGIVEKNDKTEEGKPIDIELLNNLVNQGYLEPCLDLLP